MNGKLYVVATPIGNLADISYRAIETLSQVDCIAAEDTRHVKMLLQHYGINKKLSSLHQHNEEKASVTLIEQLKSGKDIALVSDAGTPLLSDPGLPLIRLAREHDIRVIPIPGACALITALSASGLPCSRFSFEGFLPRTSTARQRFFQEKSQQAETWIFYESSHRILYALKDLEQVCSGNRKVTLARELTKLYETICTAPLDQILLKMKQDANMQKGEFVVLVEGLPANQQAENQLSPEDEKVLSLLLEHCSIKSAVKIATELTGARKKLLYQAGLDMTSDKN